jgi:uncharacterized protein YukE
MSSAQSRLDDAIIEIEGHFTVIQRDLQRLDSQLAGFRQAAIGDLEKRLSDIDTRLTRMAGETRGLPRDTKDYYDDEIKSLRDHYVQFVQELQQKKNAIGSSAATRQADQLASNANRSRAITDKLDDAIRLGNDSITTGNVAMTTLLDDRRTLEHIGENLIGIDAQAESGYARAKQMLKRACCNKCLAWIIVVLLLGLLGGEIYYKATRPK